MTKLFSFLTLFFFLAQVQAFKLVQWPSYETHREQFDKSLFELKDYDVEKMNWSIDNSLDESGRDLSTEVAIVKNKKVRPERILILSSGIHGVESYVGSSVQLAFIKEYLQKPHEKFDFAFIHILNPWGMKYNRRVNFNNVDLNRNFLPAVDDFKAKNESYEKIDGFLNPQSALQLNFVHKFMFILDSMYYILKYSMDSLRRAILQGQYQFPHGIYFGGTQHDPLKSNIDLFIEQKLQAYHEIVWIDLHTGYGERGHLHLLSNEADDENAKRLAQLFAGRKIDFGQNQKFYKTSGDMISYLAKKTTSKTFAGLAFEYGTMDSQKPQGSIESLRRMVVENQSYQFSRETDSRKDVEKLLLDMYNPSDSDWWNDITKQTQDVFGQILK